MSNKDKFEYGAFEEAFAQGKIVTALWVRACGLLQSHSAPSSDCLPAGFVYYKYNPLHGSLFLRLL